MKTTLYIDGYNIYYGLVRNTPYKWLDIVKLFTNIAKENTPSLEIVDIKFFTSPVKIKFASHGEQSQKSQNDYHNALEKTYPTLSIINGYFDITEGWFPKHQLPVDRNDKVKTWKLEEKQTDVNIALNIYRDVNKSGIEQIVLVSNDSDLSPALQAVKEDFPNIKIGAIMPIRRRDGSKTRPPNASISKYADWTREHINESELEDSQLPNVVPTKKRAYFKPKYW
jgi:uncharacterized LabA/DUF88 family protein